MTYRRGLPLLDQAQPVLSGTLAARPAAGTVTAGTVYFATDNGLAYEQVGGAWVTAAYSTLSASDVPDISATYQARSEKDAASGYAGLSAASKLAASQIPDLSATYQVRSEKAAASGYASLDAGTKVPSAQIPDLSATYQVRSEKAAASGYAGLDAGTKVPTAQLGGAGADNTKFLRGDQSWQVPAGGGGITTLILFDSTLGGDAASIDTGANGVPQTAVTLVIDCILRTTQAVAISTVLLTFNADTGGNYDNTFMQNVNATVAGGNARGAANIAIACFGASATASAASHVRIVVHNYRGTTFHKALTVEAGGADATAADCHTQHRSGRWRNTAAITRFAIAAGSGNLLTGSRVTCYGLL